MSAAELVAKNDTVSYLPSKAVYALAASSTPEGVKKKIIADVKAGKTPKANEVIEEIKQSKAPKVATPQKDARREAAEAAVELLIEVLGSSGFKSFFECYVTAGKEFDPVLRDAAKAHAY